MPSFETVKRMHGNRTGYRLKQIADEAMEDTWWNNIQTRTCYLYDYYHDNESDKMTGYVPNTDSGKIKVDLKFIVKSYKSMSKDEPDYHIQFKPSDLIRDDLVPDWFKEKYERYGIEFPIGLYCDLPDDRGIYSKWIVTYSETANQFPKYGVLKCNYRFQWVDNDGVHRIKRQMWGIEREARSYTSGEWSGQRFTVFDEIGKFILPWNMITENLRHDERLFVSMLNPEPLCYKITKLKTTNPKGVISMTCKQVAFDRNRDYVNLETGEMYADYYEYKEQEPVEEQTITQQYHLELSCTVATIRLNGGYKTITATCIEPHELDITSSINDYQWEYYIDDYLLNKETEIEEVKCNKPNKIKIKLLSEIDETYVGKTLTVKCNVNMFSNCSGELKLLISNL